VINSRSLSDLHPKVARLAQQFIIDCGHAGIEVLIYSTYRDNEAQDAEYAKGRSRPGKKVTNAKGCESFHNYGMAFDFVPLKDKTPQWGSIELYRKCGEIAVKCGLEWGGNWRFIDRPHCQFTDGHDIEFFKSGCKI
jgi:peptidoglycan L-alanyl-D-glutamate endopeptidase CwlK